MDAAQVEFRHYQVELPDAILSRFGSRYFSRKEAGKELRRWLTTRPPEVQNAASLDFSAEQLLVANEVYPEAALADPIADLEVWDEWRSGLRRFPYPGIYTRLDITQQELKVSATSSVGVLGDIFTGLFTQSFVAPFVVVRPIRRWPDLIYLSADERYSFVESKATASMNGSQQPGILQVPEALMEEGLADAVQELNAEPFLRIWLVFHDVLAVRPIRVNVSALELVCCEERRAGRVFRIPPPVVEGISEQLLLKGAADVEPEFAELIDVNDGPGPRTLPSGFWGRVREKAEKHAEDADQLIIPPSHRDSAIAAIRDHIQKTRPPKRAHVRAEGRQLTETKRTASAGRLAALRQLAGQNQWLLLADMDANSLRELRRTWKPDWRQANKEWGQVGDLSLWRCSSALLGCGDREREGTDVKDSRAL